ncbi:hypothetical protein PWT90_08248 [Aphanocladium album]|nr:hypothetical protein PWT90_08248 [Aphanocladium album]
MADESQVLREGVEIVWATNYESRRRTQNRLAQRRYREKRKQKAQQENDGSAEGDDPFPGISPQGWAADPMMDPCIAGLADMNVFSSGSIPGHWNMPTQTPFTCSSSQNSQLHMPGDPSGNSTPGPELSNYVSKLSSKANGLIAELQQLYRIGVDLEMLHSDPQLATDLGILPDRFAALIALHQSSGSMNMFLAQGNYSEDLFEDDAEALHSVTSHVSGSSYSSKG